MLVARILKLAVLLTAATINNTYIYTQWFWTAASPKWTLRGAYPARWLLLSFVMLHPFFVGIIAGAGFNSIIPGQYHQQLWHQRFWTPTWHREPPDPIFMSRRTSSKDRKPPDPVSLPKTTYHVNGTIYDVSQ